MLEIQAEESSCFGMEDILNLSLLSLHFMQSIISAASFGTLYEKSQFCNHSHYLIRKVLGNKEILFKSAWLSLCDELAVILIVMSPSHSVVVTEDLLKDLFKHTMILRVWDTKDKMSTRARFDRPKAFRLPQPKPG